MSQKYVQSGDIVEYTAPAGGVTVDVPLLIGGLVAVPMVSAAAGVRFNGALKGVFQLMPKAAGTAWSEGQDLYWDSAAGNFTTAASASARRAASAVLTALAADTVGTIRLDNIGAPVNVA